MNLLHNLAIRQQGFTLIEAMIALVILSVGLLGIASMQSLGVRMNHDAFQRTQATTLAYDVVEKMRMDSVNSLKAVGSNPYEGTITSAAENITCTDTSNTPANLIKCWQVILREQIPTGSIAISAQGDANYPQLCTTTNALAADELGIEISWSDTWIKKGATSADTSCQTFIFNVRNG